MKRFLSWVVLALCCIAFAFVTSLVVVVAAKLFLTIYDKAGSTIFWVLIFFFGSVLLGVLFVAISMGAKVSVMASQAVWKSKKGARYIVFGCVIALWFLIWLAAYAIGVLHVPNPYTYLPYYAVMLFFGIGLAIVGKMSATEEGPPPTKRERLEAQLAALDEREGKNGQNS